MSHPFSCRPCTRDLFNWVPSARMEKMIVKRITQVNSRLWEHSTVKFTNNVLTMFSTNFNVYVHSVKCGHAIRVLCIHKMFMHYTIHESLYKIRMAVNMLTTNHACIVLTMFVAIRLMRFSVRWSANSTVRWALTREFVRTRWNWWHDFFPVDENLFLLLCHSVNLFKIWVTFSFFETDVQLNQVSLINNNSLVPKLPTQRIFGNCANSEPCDFLCLNAFQLTSFVTK